MSIKYILDGQTPVPCDDILEWGRWFETANRHVGKDQIGPYRVSTVFLGIDHDWGSNGPPVLFETMVFGHADEIQQRYCTWDEAATGHAEMVARYRLIAQSC